MPKQTKKSNTTTKRSVNNSQGSSADSVFFLKLVLFMVLGSMWVKVTHQDTLGLPIPIGLIIGLMFTTHEHFQIDRKIEFAVLLVAMLVGYFAPFGLYIAF